MMPFCKTFIESLLMILYGHMHVDQEWCKRWFVLTTNELACYHDSNDEVTNDVETVLSIVHDTVVSEEDDGHSYAFRISVSISSDK